MLKNPIGDYHAMTMVPRSIRIAVEAHEGQVDKSGVPYIAHVATVASLAAMAYPDTAWYTLDDAMTVAYLHDVVEDTDVDLVDLTMANFSARIVAAVEAITHRKNEPYDDYLDRVLENPIATLVKIADVTHHRMRPPVNERLTAKYENAWARLLGGVRSTAEHSGSDLGRDAAPTPHPGAAS